MISVQNPSPVFLKSLFQNLDFKFFCQMFYQLGLGRGLFGPGADWSTLGLGLARDGAIHLFRSLVGLSQ